MKKAIYIILILVLTGIAACAGYQIFKEQAEYQYGEDAYIELEQYVQIPDPNPESPVPDESGETGELEPEELINWPAVNFEELRAVNPDIIGWVYIEDTSINYPILQGNDNDYYLTHLPDGTWNSSGAIFMDSRNSTAFTDPHTIIYGHHMKNGTMFSDLDGYKMQEFYEEHPIVLIVTPECNYEVVLFAGYVTDVESDAWQLSYRGEQFEAWLQEITEKSLFQSSHVPTETDTIVTLSTCSYEFSNARFVVSGYLRSHAPSQKPDV